LALRTRSLRKWTSLAWELEQEQEQEQELELVLRVLGTSNKP
jgi:hypothetical protein